MSTFDTDKRLPRPDLRRGRTLGVPRLAEVCANLTCLVTGRQIYEAFTGRDRRHLSELRDKFRVVVVGAQETRRGIVVDAYIPAERINWLPEEGLCRRAGFPRTIDKQLGLLFRVAAPVTEKSFCDPGRMQLYDGCLRITRTT